jgi:superfamily II DNA or RNA helicase
METKSKARIKNNEASNKCYKNKIERIHATEYEYEMVRKHSEIPNTEAYHWSLIPEDWLYEAGYIHDYNQHRLERLIHKKEYIPGKNRLKDYGFDGLARQKCDNDYVYQGLQAKYYSQKVTSNDIGSFLVAQIGLNTKDRRSTGYLYTTSDLQEDLCGFISNPSYPIRHVKHPWEYPDGRKNKVDVSAECDLPLHDYQKKIIDKLEKDSDGINALNIPCGLGKTVIAGHYLKRLSKSLIIAIAPLKSSVENLKRLNNFLPTYKTLLVDSDIGGTTDVGEIRRFIGQDYPRIIYSTFKSAENILYPIFNSDLDLIGDAFILGDEIHNANDEICDFVNIFDDGLMMTATLPEEIEEKLNINDVHRIPFSYAIEKGYITDYSVWLPYSVKKEGVNEIQVEIPIEFSSYQHNMVSKALFISTLMMKTGGRRCITYLASQEECDVFLTVARDIFENYHGVNFWGDKIIAETRDRENIIKYFQEKNSDDTFHILASVRVLDESVDIPRCDTVFITCIGEKSSDIRMTQRGMRASRIDPKNPSKHNTIALWASGWESCIDSLDNLRCSDPEFHKKINVATCDYDTQTILKDTIQRESKNIIVEVKEYFEMQSMNVWEQRLRQWIEQRNKLGRAPSTISQNMDEKRAGQWQSDQRKNYKKGKLLLEREELLNNTPGWTWETDAWSLSYKKYVEITKKLGREPSQSSKNPDEKFIARWRSIQRHDYKKGNLLLEREELLNNTPGWAWERNAWLIQYENYVEICNRLGRQPLIHSKNADEKRAAKWQSCQRQSYKSKKTWMTLERIKTLEETPGWKWEETDTWSIQYNNYVEIYNKLGRQSSQSSKNPDEARAAKWQNEQRQAYKKGKMPPERKETLNNTLGWAWEEPDAWSIQYDNYVEIYNKLARQPLNNSKNADEKRSAKWQNQQRQTYKKGKLLLERQEILNNTPGWTWSSR